MLSAHVSGLWDLVCHYAYNESAVTWHPAHQTAHPRTVLHGHCGSGGRTWEAKLASFEGLTLLSRYSCEDSWPHTGQAGHQWSETDSIRGCARLHIPHTGFPSSRFCPAGLPTAQPPPAAAGRAASPILFSWSYSFVGG
eukprot:gene7474-biopygen7559